MRIIKKVFSFNLEQAKLEKSFRFNLCKLIIGLSTSLFWGEKIDESKRIKLLCFELDKYYDSKYHVTAYSVTFIFLFLRIRFIYIFKGEK